MVTTSLALTKVQRARSRLGGSDAKTSGKPTNTKRACG
jgi:hypothetical protein